MTDTGVRLIKVFVSVHQISQYFLGRSAGASEAYPNMQQIHQEQLHAPSSLHSQNLIVLNTKNAY